METVEHYRAPSTEHRAPSTQHSALSTLETTPQIGLALGPCASDGDLAVFHGSVDWISWTLRCISWILDYPSRVRNCGPNSMWISKQKGPLGHSFPAILNVFGDSRGASQVSQVSYGIHSPSAVLPARFREHVLSSKRLLNQARSHAFHSMGICLLSVDVTVLRTEPPCRQLPSYA